MSEVEQTLSAGAAGGRITGMLRNNRGYLTNFAWLASDRVIRLAVGLVVTGMVARYLGREGFGTLNFAISVMFFFTPFATVGLHQTVMKELLAAPQNAGRVLGTTAGLKMGSGVICFLLLCTYAWLFETGETRWLVVLVGVNLLLDSSSTFDTWFESQTQAKFAVWATNAAFLTGAALKILLIVTGAPLIWFGAVLVVQGCLGLLLKARFFCRAFPEKRRWHFSPELIKPLLIGGLPIVLLLINLTLMKRLDIVMLRGFRGMEETGVYASAAQLSDVLFLVPGLVAATVLPGLMRLRESNPVKYRKGIQVYFRLNALAGYLGAIGFAIAMPLLLPLVFGERFADATPMAQVLGIAALPLFLAMSRQDFLFAEGRSSLLVWAGVAGLVVNVVLNWLLIPRFGGLGAAWATVCAYFVYGLAGSFMHPAMRKIGRLQLMALCKPWPSKALADMDLFSGKPSPSSTPDDVDVDCDDESKGVR